MGKNKQRGKKQQNVFQVANRHVKPKTKTKPVKTSLKYVSYALVSDGTQFLLLCKIYVLIYCFDMPSPDKYVKK